MRFIDAAGFEAILPAMRRLFARSHGRQVGAEILRWRYLTGLSTDLIMCVEESADGLELVANYSVSPCEILWRGRRIRAALSNRTMTDPDHAGRGHFTRLATAVYQEMRDRGYELIWGFPNKNSHYGLIQKLGWKDIYQMPTMRLELAGFSPSKEKRRFDDGFDLLYPEPDSELAQVVKPAPYLRWRYAENPENRYRCLVQGTATRVSSYCVVKPYEESLDLVDFQAASPTAGRELLEGVIALGVEEGYRSVLCWTPRHHFMHPLCERLGFVAREPITYFCARAFDQHLQNIFDFSRWFIQMGDSDVY